MCVPIGVEPGSALIAFSRRKAFPAETEQMLLRVAANQAAVSLQRWRSERALLEQKQALEVLNETSAALYRFTDRLYRATNLDGAIDAAMGAIVSALSCSRASILLFDSSGVARFAGWRGPS